MRRFRAWLVRLGGPFRKERSDADLAAELESHVQMHIEDNVHAEMTPEAARRDALMRLGGIEQTKEGYRDRRGLPWLDTLLQDLCFALRMCANFLDWEKQNHVFTEMAAFESNYFNLTGGNKPEEVRGERVTTNLFSVLGVRPFLGRLFLPEEEKRGTAPVART